MVRFVCYTGRYLMVSASYCMSSMKNFDLMSAIDRLVRMEFGYKREVSILIERAVAPA